MRCQTAKSLIIASLAVTALMVIPCSRASAAGGIMQLQVLAQLSSATSRIPRMLLQSGAARFDVEIDEKSWSSTSDDNYMFLLASIVKQPGVSPSDVALIYFHDKTGQSELPSGFYLLRGTYMLPVKGETASARYELLDVNGEPVQAGDGLVGVVDGGSALTCTTSGGPGINEEGESVYNVVQLCELADGTWVFEQYELPCPLCDP